MAPSKMTPSASRTRTPWPLGRPASSAPPRQVPASPPDAALQPLISAARGGGEGGGLRREVAGKTWRRGRRAHEEDGARSHWTGSRGWDLCAAWEEINRNRNAIYHFRSIAIKTQRVRPEDFDTASIFRHCNGKLKTASESTEPSKPSLKTAIEMNEVNYRPIDSCINTLSSST